MKKVLSKKLLKKAVAVVAAASLASLALAGCSSTSSTDSSSTDSTTATSEADKTITVGASPTPHAEILNQIKDDLAAEGYTLKVVEYNDYVLPNTALQDGELDANYFQHTAYLTDFNSENGTDLVSAGSIHFEPLGLYSSKISSVAEAKDKVEQETITVAVPNDTTNEARALLLLEQEGLIKLKDGVGVQATVNDIAEKSDNLVIKELEAAQIPLALQDVDLAVINGNYALNANLKIADALATESSEGTAAESYANIVAVKAGNENSEKTQALVKALQSDKVKKYIEENYDGAVVAVF